LLVAIVGFVLLVCWFVGLSPGDEVHRRGMNHHESTNIIPAQCLIVVVVVIEFVPFVLGSSSNSAFCKKRQAGVDSSSPPLTSLPSQSLFVMSSDMQNFIEVDDDDNDNDDQ
jgi:hypothetical protein